MALLRFFARQAHEELAFASFAEQLLHVPSTICTKLAKHSLKGLKGTLECKDYAVTTNTETVRTTPWRVTEAFSGGWKFGMSPFPINTCGSLRI